MPPWLAEPCASPPPLRAAFVSDHGEAAHAACTGKRRCENEAANAERTGAPARTITPPMAHPAPTEPSAQRAPAERRTLVPHEHGAYGQLAMPLLTALAIGRPRAASFLLTYAIVVA